MGMLLPFAASDAAAPTAPLPLLAVAALVVVGACVDGRVCV